MPTVNLQLLKRGLLRILFASLGLLLALLFAEAVCKFMDLREAGQNRKVADRISRPSRIPGVRYELIPGASGLTPGQSEVVRVNRLGFRGPEVEAAKPPDTYRIAVLGDSIGFGRTLKEEEVFPYLLPRLLAEHAPGRNYEVINASLSGRDTWEEVAVLEHRLLDLNPDLVIIQVCLNDHIRLPSADPSGRRGVFGEEAWYQYSSLLALLDKRLPNFRKLHVRWAKALGFDMRTPNDVLKDYALDLRHIMDVEPNWEPWSREFLRASELCRKRGVQLLIAVFPLAVQIQREEQHSVPQLIELGGTQDIAVVDLVDAYRPHGPGVLMDYTHPNRRGHEIAAEYLADFITRRFLQPEKKTGLPDDGKADRS